MGEQAQHVVKRMAGRKPFPVDDTEAVTLKEKVSTPEVGVGRGHRELTSLCERGVEPPQRGLGARFLLEPGEVIDGAEGLLDLCRRDGAAKDLKPVKRRLETALVARAAGLGVEPEVL